MVRKKLFALLIPGKSTSFTNLKALLNAQFVEVWSAGNCQEAARLFHQTHPELIFTDTELSDGSWKDIIGLAEDTSVPTNVIVVGHCNDLRLQITTIDYGAFDFILPPFDSESLAHVVTVAGNNTRLRREEQSIRTAG